jgi:hypothetical protein
MKPAPPPPIPLGTDARRFWDKHYRRLKLAGVLTRADVESFALLCVVWGKIQELAALPALVGDFRSPIQLDRLLKQYHAYAKQFGLLPRERKQSKMDVAPPAKKDEFGL